jgi:signal transduction histidine kinase
LEYSGLQQQGDRYNGRRVALTLRLRLLLLWLLTLAVCGALAYVMRSVYRLGAEAQTERAVALASEACSQLRTEYLRANGPSPDDPDGVLMGALLNVVLDEAPGVEGGFWHDALGFVAYAYPTHQGSEPKSDVPSTERGRIETLVRSSLGSVVPAMDLQRGSRENIVVVACPVGPVATRLGAWTMTRVPVAAGRAYDEVIRGLALLLAFAVGSGLWLSYSFYRWTHGFGRIEGALRSAGGTGLSEIPQTGDAELDRIVSALNEFRERLEAAQMHAAQLHISLERHERFAALGRMAASVAHEVRNPIAAMRLKAENALVQPERADAALAFVLREVDRLDSIVKALLSSAEPVQVHLREVDLQNWLPNRTAAFSDRAAAKQIAIRSVSETASWRLDPDAVGRALDNLIDNALDHTPGGGAVEIRARAAGDPVALIVEVRDTGPGVPCEARARLFEPFVSGRPDGIGLGLALAREIALAHGGDLRYVPQTSGACFELQIPWPAS